MQTPTELYVTSNLLKLVLDSWSLPESAGMFSDFTYWVKHGWHRQGV